MMTNRTQNCRMIETESGRDEFAPAAPAPDVICTIIISMIPSTDSLRRDSAIKR